MAKFSERVDSLRSDAELTQLKQLAHTVLSGIVRFPKIQTIEVVNGVVRGELITEGDKRKYAIDVSKDEPEIIVYAPGKSW